MEENIRKKLARNWFLTIQELICHEIENIENGSSYFKTKVWSRSETKDEGGGKSKLLKNGNVFEKVGVNFSEVYGNFSNEFKNKIPRFNNSKNFWASGISIVMHMKNPYIPAMHFNTRYIITDHGWFGGGMDFTPCFKDSALEKIVEKKLKMMCNKHDKNYYKKYKKWCDEYFYLPHRKEPRGIGGIFFDYKKNNFEKNFKFVRDVGITFETIFQKIINKKIKKKWTSKDKENQYIKRGRYAEQNGDLDQRDNWFDKAAEVWSKAVRLYPGGYLDIENWLKNSGRSSIDMYL